MEIKELLNELEEGINEYYDELNIDLLKNVLLGLNYPFNISLKDKIKIVEDFKKLLGVF